MNPEAFRSFLRVMSNPLRKGQRKAPVDGVLDADESFSLLHFKRFPVFRRRKPGRSGNPENRVPYFENFARPESGGRRSCPGRPVDLAGERQFIKTDSSLDRPDKPSHSDPERLIGESLSGIPSPVRPFFPKFLVAFASRDLPALPDFYTFRRQIRCNSRPA